MIKLIPTDDPNVFYHTHECGHTMTVRFGEPDGTPDGYWRQQLWDLSVAEVLRQVNRTIVRLAWVGSLRERYGLRDREAA